MTQKEITKMLEKSLNWDESQHYHNSSIGIYFSEKYHNSFLKTYIDKYKQNNNDVYFIVDSDFYKMNIMINNLNMILITQNEIEERKMKFDYILMNPPFSLKGNRTAYRTIIERMMKISDVIYYIGPTGALNKNMWQTHSRNIIKGTRLGWDEFPVGVACVSGYWVKNPSDEQKKVCEFQIINQTWEVNKKDYPLRVPFVKMSQKEYEQIFDQCGEHWKVFSDIPEPGIYRDKKNGLYVYSDAVSKDSVTSCVNAKYMPIKNPAKGKKLAKKLAELERDKKIHGYWQMGYQHASIDLDPIRKDLF